MMSMVGAVDFNGLPAKAETDGGINRIVAMNCEHGKLTEWFIVLPC